MSPRIRSSASSIGEARARATRMRSWRGRRGTLWALGVLAALQMGQGDVVIDQYPPEEPEEETIEIPKPGPRPRHGARRLVAPSKPRIAWTGPRMGSEDGLMKWFVLWKDNDKNEQAYELYRREKPTDRATQGAPTRPHRILSVGSSPKESEARNRELRYYDELLVPGTTYCYHAVTVGASTSRRGPEACFDFTARGPRPGSGPPEPDGPVPSIAWTGARAGARDDLMRWNVLWKDEFPNETSFELHRRVEESGSGALQIPEAKVWSVGSSPDDQKAVDRTLLYYDPNLAVGSTYCYRVSAIVNGRPRRGPEACFPFTARRGRAGHPPPVPLEVKYLNDRLNHPVVVTYLHRVDPGPKELRGVRVVGKIRHSQTAYDLMFEQQVETDKDKERRVTFQLPSRHFAYCYKVQTFNEYGDSPFSELACNDGASRHGDDRRRADGVPFFASSVGEDDEGADPLEDIPDRWVRTSLSLRAQPTEVGSPISYMGRLDPVEVRGAVLRRVRVSKDQRFGSDISNASEMWRTYGRVHFLPEGRSPEECNHDYAVVTVRAGDELGPQQMRKLWFDREPPADVLMRACATHLPNEVKLDVWYEPN